MRQPQRIGIPQRRRIFLGCEGESEQSYGALLARLVELRHRRIYVDNVLLRPGGGDPLALVELAVRLMRQRVDRGGKYVARAVLLDNDKIGQTPERDRKALALAEQHGLRLIWQDPCHEALILRHLDGCAALRPPTCGRALAELRNRWPEYEKPMSATRLAKRIDRAGANRAAAVDPELLAFLIELEFGQD